MTCKYCNDTGYQESCITGVMWECLECKPKVKTMSFGPGKRSNPKREYERYQESLGKHLDSLGTGNINDDEMLAAIIANMPSERSLRSRCIKETIRDILKYHGTTGHDYYPTKGKHFPPSEHYSLMSIDHQMDFVIPPDPPDNLYPNFKTDSYKKYRDVYGSLKDMTNQEGVVLKVGGEAKGHTVKNIILSKFRPADLSGLPVKMVTSDEILKKMDEESRQLKSFFSTPAPPPAVSVPMIMITDGPDELKATPAQLKVTARNKWWDNLLGS